MIRVYTEMFEKFVEENTPETHMLASVMALCNAYHGMDVVIASYENMLAERDLEKANNQQEQQRREQEQQQQLETWQVEERQCQAADAQQKRQDEESQKAYEKWLQQQQSYQPSAEDLQRFWNMKF